MSDCRRFIELGGGANPTHRPNVDVRQCFDAEGNPTVDFTADFNEPLPIRSEEWDGVYSRFVIEHLSWRRVRGFISEVFRILKPGGIAMLITANVRKQLEWIAANPTGWDGRDDFDSFSCVLFGDQDYPENAHKNWMEPSIAVRLFREAGFASVTVSPFGGRATDMMIYAKKPAAVRDVAAAEPAKPEPTAEVCGAAGPGGVCCVLRKGHGGHHESPKV